MTALVKTDTKSSQALAATQAVVEEKQYLTFMLGGEMFSIGILCIKEIIWYANLTEVPMMPACIRGVINLRGAVVPVLDLSSRFGKPSTQVIKSTCIVIVEVPTAIEGEHLNMGVVMNSVQAGAVYRGNRAVGADGGSGRRQRGEGADAIGMTVKAFGL